MNMGVVITWNVGWQVQLKFKKSSIKIIQQGADFNTNRKLYDYWINSLKTPSPWEYEHTKS